MQKRHAAGITRTEDARFVPIRLTFASDSKGFGQDSNNGRPIKKIIGEEGAVSEALERPLEDRIVAEAAIKNGQ
jgi:hypothetical protein